MDELSTTYKPKKYFIPKFVYLILNIAMQQRQKLSHAKPQKYISSP